jgi:hypothetical protein
MPPPLAIPPPAPPSRSSTALKHWQPHSVAAHKSITRVRPIAPSSFSGRADQSMLAP